MKTCLFNKFTRLLIFALSSLTFEYSLLLAQTVKLAWSLPKKPFIFQTRLYRKSHLDRRYTLLAKIDYPDTTFWDSNIKFDKHYFYYATVLDLYGNESDKSNQVDTLIISVTRPHFFIYPNPFNDITSIYFTLQQPEQVGLTIHNMLGQKVCQLINESRNAGTYQIHWEGINEDNLPLSSGIYFCRLQFANLFYTQKMVLIR
jgi:hypothetical protein